MKKFLEIIIAGSSLLGWLLIYILDHYQINYTLIEAIILIIISLILAVHLSLVKDTYLPLVWILFIPFMFAHSFDALSVPIGLIIGVIILIIGVIINFIRFKPKLKIHPLFFSFVLIVISLIFSGIGNKENNFLRQFPLVLLMCLAFLFLIVFFCSTTEKKPFVRLIYLLCIFSIYLQLQGYLAIVIAADFNPHLMSGRGVLVGWGICNNIDLMLLFTLIAPLYFIFYFNFSKKALIICPLCTNLTFVSMTVFMSRGSLMIGALGLIAVYLFFIIYMIVKKIKKQIFYFLSSVIIVFIFLIIVGLIISPYVNILTYLKNYLSGIHFDNLNGRLKIYLDIFKEVKSNLIFGKGIFAGFTHHVDVPTEYFQWCHSTILQSLYSAGIVGLGAMLIHLFFKYFLLLKKLTIEKLFLITIMLLPGLYGLFDVSYFFINFMVVLIVILILGQDLYLERKKEAVQNE